ncbi:argininosuccinate lyase [candidate division KSB3 bacterium]|uniref:Argininosuccinate lyase n=1 Tax=candidate division KSB3 bacterium TaxID=2044937 RepID=A0A2G6EE49_9BACT|nr:MAG: argininosuccinate lyase [candidate division KSB3 bacterium]PIE28380.1 MAG: argininosuccinate lyase [candidate division KSB3 bacterium]
MSRLLYASGVEEETFNQRLHEICFQTNFNYDNLLLPYDIKALIAHGEMLGECGLIPEEDSRLIVRALEDMQTEAVAGTLAMSPEWEDCHSLIEAELIERCGDAGKRLYMGRSRNDQIVSALRLYAKDKIKELRTLLKTFMQTLLDFSKRHEMVPMPGYTHTQRAMPSSVGMWASSFLEVLLNQQQTIEAAYAMNDVNVLGSAAAYGTGFAIDREAVTRKLGFSRTQVNSLSCQLSRGQVECQTLQAFWGVMFVINRLANDLVWMSSAEFGFFTIAKSCTTGSSIMPNKRNLDPCEIIRGRYHIFTGFLAQAQSVIASLFSGYNSDYQESKPVFLEGLELVATSIEVMTIIMEHTSVNADKMRAAFSPEIFATDAVNRSVTAGKTFRDAYRDIKAQLGSVEAEDPAQNIRSKTHLGATGKLGLDLLEARLKSWENS